MNLENNYNSEKSTQMLTALWSFNHTSMQLQIQGSSFLENVLDEYNDNYLIHIDTYLEELCHPEEREQLAKKLPFLCDNVQCAGTNHRIWNKKSKTWHNIIIHSFVNMPEQIASLHKFGSFQCIVENTNFTQKFILDDIYQAILDVSPICCGYWNKNCEIIACNNAVTTVFNLSNKQEYLDQFKKLSPKYQPDGELSSKKAKFLIKKAFKDGYAKFEWIHQKLNGEPIPSEISLMRMQYYDDFIVIGYTHDLRELKAILAEKYEANKLNQLMIDSFPLSSTFWDKNYTIIKCNQESVRLFKLSNKQEYMDRFYDLSPKYQPDGKLSTEKANDIVNKTFIQGFFKCEWMHKNLDGELIPTAKTLVRVKYNDDFFVIGYTQDLRELKAMLWEKDESDKLNQIMIDATPLSSTFWDKNFNIIKCNQEAVRLFGLSSKQEYMDRFHELSPKYQPDNQLSAEKARHEVEKTFKTGYTTFEWLHQDFKGEPIPTEKVLVRVQHNNDYFVIGFTRDLREIKAAQFEMRKADERIKLMLDSTPISCNFWNSDFKNVACNQEAVRLFDFSSKKEYLKNFHKLSPEYQPDGTLSSEKIPIVMSKAFNEGYSKFEWMHQKLNGELIPVEVTLVRTKLGNNDYIIGYARDLRELKTMLKEISKNENELRFARDLAEKRAMAKSEFLANMSHEIRTPINAILGMSYILLNTKLSEKQQIFVEKAQYSAKLLLLLINDILDFSKIEAGRLSIEHREFSLSKMLNNFLDIVRDQAATKELYVNMTIDPKIPDILLGDSLRLEQILMNLSSNALKFTQKGGLNIYVSQSNKVFEDKNQFELLFEIIDTGIGMTQDQMDALFNPFTQADNSTTRKYGGTGLGLAISRSLTILMSGDIWCTSTYGEGSKFSFTLQFGQNDKNTSCLPEDSNKTLSTPKNQLNTLNDQNKALNDADFSSLHNMHILLVEDNEINQMVATELLICKGIIVDTANNGLEALAAIENTDYDLILMDIQMPEMDGLTATKKIRTLPKFDSLPIIAMTAHAMPGDYEKSLSVGMNDHITKPIYPNKLYAMLQKWQKK